MVECDKRLLRIIEKEGGKRIEISKRISIQRLLANVFSHTTTESDDRFVENVWPMNGFNIITTGLEKVSRSVLTFSSKRVLRTLKMENKLLLIVKVMHSRY